MTIHTSKSKAEIEFQNNGRPVTVTVTEALVLRPLLEDRGRSTESICILVPVDSIKQITTKRVHRSQQFQLRW